MALTLTEEPDRRNVRVDYTAPASTATVTFSRTGPSGTPAVVRGWQDATAAPGPVVARDFEPPIGVALVYTATAKSSTGTVLGTETATITLASAGCADTWLTDLARPTNTQQVVIESLEELDYPVPAGIHRVLNRRAPVITALPGYTPELELNMLTDTLDQRDAVRYTLGSGYPVLLRTDPEQGIGSMYLAVTEFVEERISTLGTVPARRFRASCVQAQRPDPGIYQIVVPNTYDNVRATYATYAAAKAAVASYDALAFTYVSGNIPAVPGWLPDDV